jgi:hypothetical protein
MCRSMTSTVDRVSRYLNYAGAIPMIILGTVGAILTIIVFIKQRSFRHNPTITYLLANAIMTGIHLPSVYSQSILVDGFLLGLFNTNEFACREHNYLLHLTTVSTISFTCWAAFNQYASTCRNATFRQRWNSMRVVRWTIVLTIAFWTLIYIPMLLFSGVVNRTCLIVNVFYRKFVSYVLTPLVYTILPFVLIVVFTRRTIDNIRSTSLANRHDRLMKQIRRMLFPQLMILSVSGFPFSMQVIYFEVTDHIDKTPFRRAMENLAVQIIRLLYHCNFVCTFYIYVYMSSDVRKILKKLMSHRCRK